jgi:hypothetical protein
VEPQGSSRRLFAARVVRALVKLFRTIERLLLGLGISALAVYAGVRIYGVVASRVALERFYTLQRAQPGGTDSTGQKFSLRKRTMWILACGRRSGSWVIRRP